MKSISLLASLAAVSVICIAAGCSSKSDSNTGSAGSSNGGSSSKAGSGGEAGEATTGGTTSKGGSTGAAGEAGAGQIGEGGAAGAQTTPGGAITSCGQGVLFEGDPLNDTAGTPKPAGQGLLDDPSIRNQAIAVIGSKFFVETDQEIWYADMSLATPKLIRMAGVELDSGGFINAGVACKDTTFLSIRDMAATPDGKLVVIDYVGGAVIEITDPGTATCKSNWVAGTHVKTADPSPDYPLAYGEKDGPGIDALFGGTTIKGAGIHKVAVDPTGNIYTWDEGTGKFKMIATDKDRTVSTIGATSSDDNIMGLTFLKGKLYATGVDGTNDFLIEVDPAAYKAATPKSNTKDVFRSRDHFSDVEAGHQAITAQVINDGEALIISSQQGYVWSVATDGTVLATLAGTGPYIEFSADFDPTKPHAAKDWELFYSLSNSAGGPWLALADSKLYWSGGKSLGQFTLQFSCQ